MNIYGFQRIQYGLNKGGYAHQYLINGQPELCSQIKRVSAPESRTAIRNAPAAAALAPSLLPLASSFAQARQEHQQHPQQHVPKVSSNLSLLSNLSGLSDFLKGSTGSLGSFGSQGMGGPGEQASRNGSAGNHNTNSSTQNATFNLAASGGSTGSLSGLSSFLNFSSSSLMGLSGLRDRPLDSTGDISAFGKPTSNQLSRPNNESSLSLLSTLSSGNMSGISTGSNTALHMNGSEMNMFKRLFQPKELQQDMPILESCSSSFTSSAGKQNATFDMNGHQQLPTANSSNAATSSAYVASNGFLEKKPSLLGPSTDELLGLVGGPVAAPPAADLNNDDLNRSEAVFPTKLHRMLSDAKREGFEHIVSWIHGGTAFRIHNVAEFMQKIAPLYFGTLICVALRIHFFPSSIMLTHLSCVSFTEQSKFESFRRQLNLYGFTRVTRGASRGMYYHENFVQNDVSLCRNITRPKSVRKRKSGGDSTNSSGAAARRPALVASMLTVV